LFDLEGKIVGINSSIGVSWKNNNHAGIDGFVEDWDKLLAGKAWGRLSMNPLANPEMPVLGIEMGLDGGRGRGVPVERVYARSPAALAGIRAGDVVIGLDGGVVKNGQDLMTLLAKREPGDVVKAVVRRDDRDLELEVTLGKREELFREE
jgi:serine protease Do